jgi:hypothetical protein
MKTNLTANRVAEKLERPERLGEALDMLHRLKKWRDEEPHDTAIQLHGKTGAEPLTDMECHCGMKHGKAEANE